MKKGKGEEILIGTMFPRLHVNDKEKGGPRAPPRNKMALYEQLSIPSQRFNPNKTANSLPPSSSQGNGHERGAFSSVQLPPSRHLVEKRHGRSSNSDTPLIQVESRKKAEGDDFTVPIFVNSDVGQKLSSSGPDFSGRSIRGTSDSVFMDKPDGILKQTDVPLHYGPRDGLSNNFGILHKTDLVRSECRFDSQVDGTVISKSVRSVDDGDSFSRVKDFASEEHITPDNLIDDADSLEDETCKSLQTGILDLGDDLSETSVVESVSGKDISPDDVVGMIGQEQFWKARRFIARQQRVLALQVFELHRLLKVQKLIADSQNGALEDDACLGQSLKSSSTKVLPLEYIVEAPQNVLKPKNDSEKSTFRTERTPENTGKTSFSSVQNGSQPSNYKQFPGNPSPQPSPVTHESNMGPWCFPQPSGHQWLIPVMTPLEGLVYKPYPGPGFMSPVVGPAGPTQMMGNYLVPSYGATGPIPMMGSYLASAYGAPASHHPYQGMGFPFGPPTGHGYFPPFGMPATNPNPATYSADQSNQFSASGSQGQLSEEPSNSNAQHHNSSNIPSEKHAAVPELVRLRASRDTELQPSIASSASERAHGVAAGKSMGGRSELSLFPTSPTIDNHHFRDPSARIIKVVPHNARSATESVARIFQSIQEERKQ